MRKLKVSEVADVLGVSAPTVRRMTEAQEIKAQRLSNGYRVYDQDEVERVRKTMERNFGDRVKAAEGRAFPFNSVKKPRSSVTDLITGEQACSLLGISRETLRRWEQAGRIASINRRGRKLFHPETVEVIAKATQEGVEL